MQNPENSFSPLLIDQQIEHPATSLPRGEAHLIHDLQLMYDQENSAAINRVWTHLALQRHGQHALFQERHIPETIRALRQRTDHLAQRKHEPRQASTLARRVSLLAALLVVTLLVGSLALVFAFTRGDTATGLPVSSASGWGRVVHIQTMQDSGFNGLAWSPDSKRIAASNRASSTNLVRIWDAATGQHLVTVSIHEFVNTLAWSPDSQQVAIATDQSVLIADGQTGQILHTLATQSQPSAAVTSGRVPLSSLLPGSSGAAIRDIAWSPGGSQIAVSFFGGTSGSFVLVWNVQSGARSRLPLPSKHGVEGVSWSSDGKYIAAATFQTAYTDPLSQSGVTVWNVATRQMILQKNTGSLPDINVVLAWQPGTHALAQIGVVKADNGYTTAILLFDGTTGKMLKRLVVPVSDVLTWSPDGRYLAYTSPLDLAQGNTATILEAPHWSTVYTYKSGKHLINELAWSRNGHYIATGETVVEDRASVGVVKVWATLD